MKYLLSILCLFIFSCDSGGDAEVEGCTDANACNFNADATIDDNSCEQLDCNNECGGDAELDGCGVCNGDGAPEGFVCDIEGNTYPKIQIGQQIWMKENLRVTKYRDLSSLNWQDFNSLDVFGLEYQWDVIMDERGICPEGWHIPTKEEFIILTDFLGGADVAGLVIKDIGYWPDGAVGNNGSEFSMLPRYENSSITGNNNWGYLWTSTSQSGTYAYIFQTYYLFESADISNSNKTTSFPIRCIQD